MAGVDPVKHPILDSDQTTLNGVFELDDGSDKSI